MGDGDEACLMTIGMTEPQLQPRASESGVPPLPKFSYELQMLTKISFTYLEKLRTSAMRLREALGIETW